MDFLPSGVVTLPSNRQDTMPPMPQPQQNQGQQRFARFAGARYGALVFLLGHVCCKSISARRIRPGVVAKHAQARIK